MKGSSPRRQSAVVRLDADHLNRARTNLGGTLNDAVLSVIAGGLRSWLAQHGDTAAVTGGGSIRAFIPVSMRGRRAGRRDGGNQLSGYLCDLPVGEPDPVARARTVQADMRRNKAAGPTQGAGAFPLVAEALPAAVHRVATPLLGWAAPLLFDAMVTTVPLPDVPLRLDAAELREIYPMAALAPGAAAFGLFSALPGAAAGKSTRDPRRRESWHEAQRRHSSTCRE